MQQEVQIVNKASNSLKSLSKIKRELKLKVSKWTIWRDKFLFEPQLNRCFELASLFARFESDRKHLGQLVRIIYAENKQYKSVAELKQAILTAWNGLSLETFQNHINSMSNRIFQVINRNGDATDY